MNTIDEMAVALRFAKAYLQDTPHGKIIKRRVERAIAAYDRERQTYKYQRGVSINFTNRLMQ